MTKKGLLVCLTMVVGLSQLSTLQSPATYYVSKAGSNSNSCAQAQTLATAKLTITAGISCISAGDTLFVRVGDYVERIDDPPIAGTSWSNKVRIAAYPGDTVWMKPIWEGWDERVVLFSGAQQYIEIDGINLDGEFVSGSPVALYETHHIRLQNLEIQAEHAYEERGGCAAICGGASFNEYLYLVIHGSSPIGGCGHLCSSGGIYTGGDDFLIDNVEIYATSGFAVQLYNGGSGWPERNIIRNSKFHDINLSGYEPEDAANARRWGIDIVGDDNQVYNNLFYNSTGPVPGDQKNAAIYVFNGARNKLWNNTIYDWVGPGIWINSGSLVADTEVINNIVYQTTGSAYADFGAGTTCGGVCSTTNMLTGVDPLFVNAGAADFHLQAGSPARDAGVTVASVTTDLTGLARPQGPAFDKGAYEYAPGGGGPFTYYVATTGSDAVSCTTAMTIGTPKLTIAAGVGCLASGDTLYVRGGTYVESLFDLTSASGTSWVTYTRIWAYQSETVWLAPTDNNNVGILVFGGNEQYIDFKGINLDGGGVMTAGIWTQCDTWHDAHHLRFQEFEIKDTLAIDVWNSGLTTGCLGSNEFIAMVAHGNGGANSSPSVTLETPNNLIELSTIYNFLNVGIKVYSYTGQTPTGNIIRRNYIHDPNDTGTNTLHGIEIGTGADAPLVWGNIVDTIPNATSNCLYLSGGTLALIYNNTLYNCTQYNFRIDAGVTSTTSTNNVMYAGGGTLYSNAGTGTVITTSKSDGVNPLFTDAPGGVFTVGDGSNLIDTGTTVAAVTVDFDGTTRPVGAAFDIGAHDRAAAGGGGPDPGTPLFFRFILKGRP